MENFIVSARKYRPASFDTVVGQSSITSTLKNALLNKQVAQAFLFCGPRGVGKTTCARILAKTINCMDITASGEACDKCESCTSFSAGNSLNIFELDAASNNSVDDIRSLINQVRIAPTVGTKKAYIIDEVHMLSQAAFNAFLKTLEEPPAHAVFILATTEKHKVLPTILSRCQIFNFNRIGAEDMANHLSDIAVKESINADNAALHIIAQKADGGLRDALSIFDQLVSFSGGELSYENVIKNLNILDYDYYFKTTDLIQKKDLSGLLLLLNEVLNNGFEDILFMNGLASHFRNLLVSKDESTLQLLEVGESIKEKYKTQSVSSSLPLLIGSLEVLSNFDVQYRTSKNKRLLSEVTLMQLCSDEISEGKKKSPVE
jgi:DNA polymerase-3 subunit gamma/tau